VMRDLYVLKKTKTLSFGERKMLDTARSLLVKELALAKSVTEEEIEKKIASYFDMPVVAVASAPVATV
jgi:CarD family transcriptional regulator